MKTFATSQSTNKSFATKATKMKGKHIDKFSPEYKLGLGIEKLLEQGVRVEKIDDVVNSSDVRGDMLPVKKGFGRATNKNICLVKAKPKRRRRRRHFKVVDGQRVSKLTQKQLSENKDPSCTNLKFDTVKNAVEACLKNLENFLSKNSLLDEGIPLHLQVCCIRKPVTPKRFVRYQLPHSFVQDPADICLIVQDQKSWNNKIEDPELTINEVQDFLKANNVTSIKKIITMHQLKTDYMSHEMRRKLCHSYDFFLADNRLREEIFSILGKVFQKTRKAPVAIHMKMGNLKERIDKALAKSTMKISSVQDVYVCQIGHTKQEIDHLCENIVAVGQQLDKLFPGSFKNVRRVSIKSARSVAFPIYYSTRIINEVETPVVKPIRPKLYEVATDELSTIGKQVQVHPDGTVKVINNEKLNKSPKNKHNVGEATKSPLKKDEGEDNDDDDDNDEPDSDEEFKFYSTNDEDFDDNENDMDSDSPFTVKKKMKNSKSVDSAANDSDDSGNDESDSEDDDFSRKTEEAYLQSLGGDEDDDNEDDEEKEEEVEEEEEEEVKKVAVVDNKKRKTTQTKNATNVTAKKFKASFFPDQFTLSAMGNDKLTSPKQNNSSSNKQKAKSVKRTFDTSLGETWTIKKKCEAPTGEKGVIKRKKSKAKLNKSQKKGNLKMKKAKLNKD